MEKKKDPRDPAPVSPTAEAIGTTYNPRSPVIKRILQELREVTSEESDDFFVAPLEGNVFEWHFSIRGPPDSQYECGIYHGRILLPHQYPLKPPNVIFLTPNGRFVVGEKICLSISAYHTETWQPGWSIRTALVAIISFMTTKGEGAIGALDQSPETCRRLATRSQQYKCDICGVEHASLARRMLKDRSSKEVPEFKKEPSVDSGPADKNSETENGSPSEKPECSSIPVTPDQSHVSASPRLVPSVETVRPEQSPARAQKFVPTPRPRAVSQYPEWVLRNARFIEWSLQCGVVFLAALLLWLVVRFVRSRRE